MKRTLMVLGFVAVGVIACVSAVAQRDDAALSAVRAAVDARYAGIAWVNVDTLARWMRAAEPPQLLDTRARAEFDVSHLPGALWVDPDSPDLSLVDPNPRRRVVVYCSVGWRSGRVAQLLSEGGRPEVYNLQEGLFGWANSGRPMVRGGVGRRDGAETALVHPFDSTWGQMLHEEHRAPLP
jgi:rhodanese-related sulfurtransferase